ncbi:hypothetical protein FDECE_18077 [Fusarium decemcellulare]|nr:hypothetical protein FDECE_18077 [Fusarium decemcellulare]
MLETVQPRGRARSNSLQRMLDLEKKLNFQRTHQGSVPPSPACTDSSSVPPSPGFPPRRFELVPKDGKKAPPPVRTYSAVPPPLFSSHTAPARTESPNMIPRKPVGHGPARSSSREHFAKNPTSDKPAQKTVAFTFPPDVEEHRSVCQSPTWEAYDRRKKEKKEEKRKEIERKKEEEKKKEKEREQAMNDALEEAWKNAPKPRGRKLVKAHPSPPTALATQGRSMTAPVQPPQVQPAQQKRRSRSSSLLGFSIGRNNDEPDEPRRSRSSSLTSLFRKSFEIRRASFDETSSTGFLGGVKLEKKKDDFHKQVLEDQAKGNSKVHPALRKSFLGHGSFTPLKTGPQAPDKEKDAQKRAYPPISINTAAARGQSMKSPKSPKRRGSVNIYLWSARARRNSVSDECAVADDTEDEEEQKCQRTPDSEVLYNKAQGLNRRGGVHIKKDQNSIPDLKAASKESEEHKSSTQGESHRPSSTATTQSDKAKDVPPLQIKKTAATATPEDKPATVSKPPIVPLAKPQPRRGSSASSALSVPPEPPRKSSKRNSLVFLTRLQTHQSPQDEVSSPKSASTPKEKNSMESSKSSKSSKHTPPSIRYEHTSPGERPKPITADSAPAVSTKWNLREAAKSAFSRGHSAQGSVSSTASATSKEGGSPNPAATWPRAEPPNHSATSHQAPRGLNITTGSLDAQNARHSPKHLSPSAAMPSGRPTTSSSESSYSDAVQSVSPLSTPHTTPPQSEMGHSPRIATIKPSMAANHGYPQVSPYWSYTNSPQLAPSDRFEPSDLSSSEAEVDPIQEAANRVMEAFSNANLRSQQNFPRKRSGLDSSTDNSIVSTPTHMQPPLRHKERSNNRLRSPVNPQSPRLNRIQSPLRGHRPTLSDPEASIKTLRRQSNLDHQHPGEPVAKMFVECCACKYYHDMPSKLYEAMPNPDAVLSSTEQLGFAGAVSMTVRCPWCKHEMSTKCCAGFAAMVYIKERFH